MKWVYGISQTYRLAFWLTVIFTVSLLTSYFIRLDVEAADQSVRSLYEDRLVAGRDISLVQERLYQNELLLQEHLSAPTHQSLATLEKRIGAHQAGIDSLVDKFAHTFLVAKEVQSLQLYRGYLYTHRQVQGQILRLNAQGARQEAVALYRAKGQGHFENVMSTVRQLASLQTTVGHQLYDQSHDDLLEADMLTYLLIGVTVGAGLVIQGLFKWSTVKTRLPYKPTLN